MRDSRAVTPTPESVPTDSLEHPSPEQGFELGWQAHKGLLESKVMELKIETRRLLNEILRKFTKKVVACSSSNDDNDDINIASATRGKRVNE